MNLREYCLKLAELGPVGEMFGGTLIATSYAFVCMVLGKFIYWVSPALSYSLFAILLLGGLIVLQLALGAISEKDVSVIMLDKFLGIFIAYAGISLEFVHWKLFAGAFILFHILLLLKPLLFYPRFMHRLTQFPGAIGLLADDVIFALLVNLFMHFGMWAFY